MPFISLYTQSLGPTTPRVSDILLSLVLGMSTINIVRYDMRTLKTVRSTINIVRYDMRTRKT